LDPFTAALVGGALANLISSAIVGAGRFLGGGATLPDLVPDGPARLVAWDSNELVTVADVNELVKLLEEDYVARLLEAHAFARFFAAVEKEINPARYFLGELEDAFVGIASSRLSGDDVEKAAKVVWRELTRGVDFVVSVMDVPSVLSERELKFLGRLEPVGTGARPGEVRPPRFLRQLASLLADPSAIDSTLGTMQDVRDAYSHYYSQMSLEHTIEGGRSEAAKSFHFDQMYIERSATNADGVTVKVDGFLTGARRSRFVILGDPGAGKSTLMQHVVRLRSQDEAGVPIILRIREIGTESPVLIEEIVATLRRDLQLHSIGTPDVERMMSLGGATVIFDGLDEAGDVPQRRLVARAINAFVKQFPLANYLVTSRSVGYGQASLGDPFPSLNLIEFSDEEIMEYAKRWFGGNGGRDGDAEALYAELETVPDLRRNPLMLSLVCTLYRARGHVPRNRRDVYAQCADLLFNRWDPMRRITQPFDQIEYGQDLMQELALWFYKSRAAQKGVERRQLEGVVQRFFEDTAGVLRGEAGGRARSFIEYCADRAWLLTWVSRNEHGEQLFTFTHRTFMEYFAATSLARGSRDAAGLAKHVRDAYRENESSVVPELIVQSAEFVHRGLGREIIAAVGVLEKELGTALKGIYLPLRLRLASVLSLPPNVIQPLFVEALSSLSDIKIHRDILDALFRIPKDQRQRLFAQLGGDPEAGPSFAPDVRTRLTWASSLMEGWVRRYLTAGAGALGTYMPEWREEFELLWERVAGQADFQPGVASRLWVWLGDATSALPALAADELEAIVLTSSNGNVPGKVVRAFEDLVLAGQHLDRGSAVMMVLPEVVQPGSLHWSDAVAYARESADVLAKASAGRGDIDEAAARGVAVLAMIVHESEIEDASDIAEEIGSLVGFSADIASSGRSRGKDKRSRVAAALAEVQRMSLPDWINDWCRGRADFIRVDPKAD
jgi:hypothetical protein